MEALDARLCLAGHGRTFSDVQGHIEANRSLVLEHVAKVEEVVTSRAVTAFEAVPLVHGEAVTTSNANWWIQQTLCYLRHLEVTGRAARIPGEGGGAERWTAA